MPDPTDNTRRHTAAIAAVLCALVVVGGAGVVAAQTTITGSGGTPEVNLPSSGPSLNSHTASGNELVINTTDGNVTVNGTGTVWLYDVTGEYTNTTNLSVSGSPTTIDPADKQAVTVAGDTESLNFSAMVVNDNQTDFVYNGSSGDTSLTIETGLPNHAKLRAVDQTGTELDAQRVDDNGSVTFVMPNSKHAVELKSQNLSAIAPLYPNATTNPGLANWTNGSQNASLDTLADYIGRVPGVAIGGSAGIGAAPALLLGLVMMGVVVVGGSSVGAGPVAGAVAGMSVIGVITALGLAPAWLWAVVLFGLGAVATAVVVRAWS